jgi:hypothetical protein
LLHACRSIDKFVDDFKAKGLPLYCEHHARGPLHVDQADMHTC